MPGIPINYQPMFDPPLHKDQLRRKLRRARNTLDAGTRARASLAITERCVLLPDWAAARRVALYLAADGEVDPAPLETIARRAGKELFLPVIQPDNSLRFARWCEGEVLVANRFGIPEPGSGSAHCAAADLDIIFLPLVGWDRSGVRLGMGGGFYDRTLANAQGPLRVGLAYALQEETTLPAQPWDARLHYVATETALVCCQASN